MRIKRKKIVIDIILGVSIPTVIAVLLLSPILFAPGIPFYGDELYYSRLYLPGFFSSQLDGLYAWVEGAGPNSILTLLQYTLPLTVFETFFDHSTAIKLLLILMASLPAMSMYIAIRVLLALRYNRGSSSSQSSGERVAAFVGGLIMMLSFTNPGLTQWGASMVWAYAMMPLSLAFFAKFLKSGSWRDAMIIGFATVLASTQPFGLYLFLITATLYLLIELLSEREVLLIKRAMFVLGLVFLFNAFWLVPRSAGYLMGAGGIFTAYAPEKLISFESLRFLSFWNLLDVLMVGEHSYYFFWQHPQNYGPLNAIIPIFASLSIIKFRTKYVLYMALILIIGIFLTKGVSEPGGYSYYLVASHLPYGAGAILRNPTKFASLVIFSYGFLVGLFISYVCEHLPSIKFSFMNTHRAKLKAFFRYGALFALIALVLSPITYGTTLHLQDYTWPRYKPTYIPKAYDDVNSWLSSQEGDFKVIWLGGACFLWKDGYIVSAFPDYMSTKPYVSSNYIWPNELKETNNIGQLLSILGVKYLIFHSDSVDFPNDEAYSLLKSQEDLKLLRSFEMPSLGLERQVLLEVDYKIPEPVIDAGFKGQFWDGFNMRMAVLPIDREVALEKVWENKMAEFFAFNQQHFNDLEGTVYFNITIPSYFKGLGVSLYLNYYDGGFKSISPVYYLGALTFDSTTIHYEQSPDISQCFNATIAEQKVEPKTAEIYVFENTNIVAPIYTSLQLPSNFELQQGNSVTLVRYELLSPVEWHISIDASAPFFLVFTEPYDPLWRAYVNGKEIEPIKPYLINVFYIEDSGHLYIKIYYKLQDYFNLGYVLSLVTVVVLVAGAIFDKLNFGAHLRQHRTLSEASDSREPQRS